jgi:hypothetical protein
LPETNNFLQLQEIDNQLQSKLEDEALTHESKRVLGAGITHHNVSRRIAKMKVRKDQSPSGYGAKEVTAISGGGEGVISAHERYQLMLAQMEEEEGKSDEYHPKYGKKKTNHLRGLQKGLNQDIEDFRSQLAMKAFFSRQQDASIENMEFQGQKQSHGFGRLGAITNYDRDLADDMIP